MLLTFFVIFCIIAFGLYLIGFKTNIDALKILAFTLAFIVGMVFIVSGIDYKSGQTEVVTDNTTVITDNYSTYQNHTLAFFFVIAQIVGMITVMVDRRSK